MLRNAEVGALYLIGGEPGTGKGFLARLIASKISRENAETNIVRVKKAEDLKKKGLVYITENKEIFDNNTAKFTSSLWLAPLRERKMDMIELIEYFIQESGDASRSWYGKERLGMLLSYWWPFNIQELKRVIETEDGFKMLPYFNMKSILPHFSVPEITKMKIESMFDDLGLESSPGKIYQLYLDSVEKIFIELSLRSCGRSVMKTAEFLGVHRNTLTQKIKKLGIKNKDEEK